MKVDILEHLEDGTQRRVATFHWRDGELNCDNPVLWKHLMNSSGGVIIGARGKRFYPRDGVEYLRNLKYQFAGPYLYAQPPVETEGPEPVRGIPGPHPAPAMSGPLTGGTFSSPLAGSTLTGRSPVTAPVVPPPPEAPEEPPQPPRGPAGRTPIGRGNPAARAPQPARKPAPSPSRPAPRNEPDPDDENALLRQTQEAIFAGVFRLSAGLRGLAFNAARLEADQLLKLLAELVQIDFAALKRSYESREEYLELRYQPPSRLNYPKVWERINRTWQTVLEVLQAGDLANTLWPLFLVREGLATLPEHRSEWVQSSSLIPLPAEETAGAALADIARAWDEVGAPMFRRKGLTAGLLEEVHALAAEPLSRGVAAFQQASFGLAEAELRQALLIDPGQTEARLLLGDLLRRMDRVPESLGELQQTVELEHLSLRTPQAGIGRPSSYLRMARARACIGRALLGLGKVRDAAEQLEKGLETLDWLTRKNPMEVLEEPERAQLKDELGTMHRLLEPICRALGETERADQHRKRYGSL
jgi:tetratricopeptide (TPR) repeat protein